MRPQDSIMVLDLVDSGVIMLDKQGHIAFWNQFISQSSHIDFKIIEGKPLLDVFPSLVNSRIHKAVDKAIDLNFPSILSYKLLKTQFPLYKKSLATKPPYLIIQSIIIKPIIENNENNGCIIYINDVSAASKREEDLNHQSAKLKAALKKYEDAQSQFEEVFESAHTGIVVFDKFGKIGRSNEAALSIFSLSYEEVIDKKINELLPNIDRYLSQDLSSYSLEYVKEFNFEQAIPCENDKHVFVSISQIDEEGDFFVYINDVTEEKLVEKRLLNANAELEEFAYRTSHDLRSPLVSTISLLAIAKESLEKQEYKTVMECFEHSDKSLRKLELLIRDILKLTESKNCEEPHEEIDLEGMIKESFDSVDKLEGFEDIDCRIDLKHSSPLISKRTRVNMILENLISNSIKYRNPESKNSYIAIESHIDGSDFVLSVSDNGLGIPDDQKDKLFKMFNRFHPNVSFGSGLGLYLMKKSAEVLGGDICYVDQGQGAMFKLTIPQQQTHQQGGLLH